MKTCKRCGLEYDDVIPVPKNPAQELSDLFLEATDPERGNDLCPDCRDETGIFNLLGFGQ